MVDFRLLDNIALLAQLILIFARAFIGGRLPLSVRLNVAVISLLFTFPTNLIAQTVSLNGEDTLDVPRSWLYKQKYFSYGSEAFGAVYFVLVGTLLMNVAIILYRERLFLRVAKWHVPLFILLLWGLASTETNEFAIEFRNLGYTIREFVAISCGLCAGIVLLISKKAVEAVERLITDLCMIVLLGAIPFILADSSVLWAREFNSAWLLPSQSAVLPGYFAISLWWHHRKSLWRKIFALLFAVLALYSVSKDALFIYLIVMFVIITRLSASELSRFPRAAAIVIIASVGVCNIGPIVLNHYYVLEPFPSLETRYFQMANALAALRNGTVEQILFGRGWNQWYPISVSFPFMDWMSGPIEEVTSTDARYMISVPFVATMRSIGVLGLLFVVIFLMAIENEMLKSARKYGPLMAVVCFTVLVNFAFTAVTGQVESMVLISLLTVVLIHGDSDVISFDGNLHVSGPKECEISYPERSFI